MIYRDYQLRIFRVRQTLLTLTFAITASAFGTTSQENVSGYGVWAHGDIIVLFAQAYPCPPGELPPPGAAQLFVSTDGGKGWEKRGPRLAGSEFQYIHEAGTRLWIVGEHTAEGPASEPFILVPDEKSLAWSLHVIYEGASELEGIAVTNSGDFIAWIRHLKLKDNGWTGPLFVHKSSDGGQTWHVVGRATKGPRTLGTAFKKIEEETATWRVTNQDSRGSAVEYRPDENSPWKLVMAFQQDECGQ